MHIQNLQTEQRSGLILSLSLARSTEQNQLQSLTKVELNTWWLCSCDSLLDHGIKGRHIECHRNFESLAVDLEGETSVPLLCDASLLTTFVLGLVIVDGRLCWQFLAVDETFGSGGRSGRLQLVRIPTLVAKPAPHSLLERTAGLSRLLVLHLSEETLVKSGCN